MEKFDQLQVHHENLFVNLVPDVVVDSYYTDLILEKLSIYEIYFEFIFDLDLDFFYIM